MWLRGDSGSGGDGSSVNSKDSGKIGGSGDGYSNDRSSDNRCDCQLAFTLERVALLVWPSEKKIRLTQPISGSLGWWRDRRDKSWGGGNDGRRDGEGVEGIREGKLMIVSTQKNKTESLQFSDVFIDCSNFLS